MTRTPKTPRSRNRRSTRRIVVDLPPIEQNDFMNRVEFFARKAAKESKLGTVETRLAVTRALLAAGKFLNDRRRIDAYGSEISSRAAQRIACQGVDEWETEIAYRRREERSEKTRSKLRAQCEDFDAIARREWLKGSTLGRKGATREKSRPDDRALLAFKPLVDSLVPFWSDVRRRGFKQCGKLLPMIHPRLHKGARTIIAQVLSGQISGTNHQPKRLAMTLAFIDLQNRGLLRDIAAGDRSKADLYRDSATQIEWFKDRAQASERALSHVPGGAGGGDQEDPLVMLLAESRDPSD